MKNYFQINKIDREIFRLAGPNILSNISVPLLSTVDTALMGRLSEQHIGAVGIASMIFNFLYWNFGFLRMGTTGMTAQAYGRDNKEEIISNLGRAIFMGLLISILLLLLQDPLMLLGGIAMNASDGALPLIEDYFFIRILAAPASLCLFAMFGWFFGMQNAIYPLILTIFLNVINIGFSFYFVHYLDWEIAGVAWGTVIAQYAGLFLAGVLFLYKYKDRRVHFQWKKVLHRKALGLFLKVNRDIFIRTLFLTFAFAFFYAQSSKFGAEILAVNVILLQYVNWMSYGIDGFAFAAESIIGKYFGADGRTELEQGLSKSFLWAGVMATLFALIYGLFSNPLLAVFTTEKSVQLAALPYLWWVILFPLASFACYIWDGVYIGLTASKSMRNAMFLAFLVFLLVFWTLQNQLQNHALWAALLVFMIFRAIFQWFLFRRKKFALN